MTLEERINFCLKWYPGLYDKKYGRIKILDDLFLGIGFGYKWSNGQLVAKDHTYETEEGLILYRQQEHEESNKKKLSKVKTFIAQKTEWEYLLNERANVPHEADSIREHIEEIKEDIQSLYDEINKPFDYMFTKYPAKETPLEQYSDICNYSLVSKIPDDVQEDHLLGIIELLEHIINIGSNAHPHNYDSALIIRSEIKERFKK